MPVDVFLVYSTGEQRAINAHPTKIIPAISIPLIQPTTPSVITQRVAHRRKNLESREKKEKKKKTSPRTALPLRQLIRGESFLDSPPATYAQVGLDLAPPKVYENKQERSQRDYDLL